MSSRPEDHTDENSAYRAIFEASSDGLVINDAETGIVLEANPAFCRMHGYDQMVGLHPTVFIHPDSHHLFAAYIRAIHNGTEFRTRAQDVRRDGTIFDVEVVGRGFMYQGRFALLGVVRDMTEHVRAYQDLEARVAERTREIERRREVAEALSELLSVVNSRRALDDMLSAIMAQAARLLDSDAEALYLVDEADPALLRLQASRNIPPEVGASTVALGTPVIGLAAERRRPAVAVDLPALVMAPPVASVDEQILDRGSYLEVVHRGPASATQAGRQLGNQVLAEHFHSLVVVPLMARGSAHGALMLAYQELHPPADDELELIAAFAGQAGLAIESARLHDQSEQRRREMEVLYQADERLYQSLRLDDVLQALVDEASGLLHAERTSVLVWDDAHQQLSVRAAHGFAPDELAYMALIPGESISSQVAATGALVAVRDVLEDPRIPPYINAAMNSDARIRSLVSVPIKLEGEVFGVFNVNWSSPNSPGLDEQRLVLALAQRAALGIQKARLHEESERQRRELEALYEADEALHRSLRLQDVLNALVDAAVHLLHVDGVGVWGPDPRLGGRLAPLASHGLSAEYLVESTRLNEDPRVLAFWQKHDSLLIEDILTDTRVPPSQRLELAREGYRAVLMTQIRIGADPFGSFSVGLRTPHRFSAQEQRLLLALAQRAGLAIQNANLYEQAQQAATLEERQRLARELHDAVTQTLFSTALIAEVLPELWDLDAGEARERLADLRRLTRGALAEMRTLLVELRPDALTQLALGDLLRQLAEATAGRTRLDVESRVDGPVRRLPPEVHVALYRIAQEALNNVVKHAEARHASLELVFTDDGARLRVRDDGRGFDTDSTLPAGHFGLGIMRERAASIGAHLQLLSQPGEGTLLEVSWTDTSEPGAASPFPQVQDSPDAG